MLETTNCIARPFTEDDFNLLYSLHSDPTVMFYIGQGVRSEEQVKIHLQNIINHQNTYGYSAWAVYEKATGNFVGRIGLIQVYRNK